MKIKYVLSSIALALLCATGAINTVQAQGSAEMIALLQRVENNQSEEATRNREREARFQAERDQQQKLMADAQAEVARQEKLRDDMKKKFDDNEVLLGELAGALDRRVGDLGELFGVFRQMADDTQTILFDSLITLEYPERTEVAAALAESTEVPTIPQMRSLWQLLLQEAALSGQISKFNTEIVSPGGAKSNADVVRIGTFNVVSGDNYLNFVADTSELVVLPRQPQGYVRSSAETLTNAASGDTVGIYLDPSRGALLGLLVQSPSLTERVEQGKEVGYAIICVGVLGLLLVLERFLNLMRIKSRMKKQMKNLDTPTANNPLGRILSIYYENKHLDLESIKRKLDEVVFRDLSEVRKGLPVIKVLAAVAPLMGLLGTVTGMIGTFQAITLFGTGDPKLMAGGISTALVTTVLGLCAAIPLLLSYSMLASQVTAISKMIGEQAAAIMAEKAESDARLKG